jgi:hypothetical protein
MRSTNRSCRPSRTSCSAALVATLALSAPPAWSSPTTGHSEQGFDLSGYAFITELLLSGAGVTHAVIGPDTPNFDTQLYLFLDDHALVTLNADGELNWVADLSEIHFGPAVPPTFDVMGLYDGSIFLVATNHYIGEVETTGVVSQFAPQGPPDGPQANSSVACDPFGWFGGSLFLTDAAGFLSKVTPDGNVLTFAAGLGGEHHHLLFSEGGGFGTDLFIADAEQRRIFRVRPEHAVGDPAEVWVDFTAMGLDIEPVNMVISKGGPFGTDIMYVSDESGQIILLSPGGIHLSDFPGDALPDSSGRVWIELPRDGWLQDRMIVVAEGSVWQIRPVPAVQWTPGGDADTADLDEVDLHADGILDELDLVSLFGALGCNGPDGAGDLDQDGGTDEADLSIFLGWFAGDATMP